MVKSNVFLFCVMQHFSSNTLTSSHLESIQASRALEKILEDRHCVLCKLPFLTTVTAVLWTYVLTYAMLCVR